MIISFMDVPGLYLIYQSFSQPVVKNIEEEVVQQLKKIEIDQLIHKDQKVAITAGSRGIKNIAKILKVVVKEFKDLGAKPFIVPAMGSHGGGTAEGQTEVLDSLGINEEAVGAPIISDTEVVELGRTEKGAAVYMDKNAFNADAIFVINRVKPHTKFKARIESGLMKMIAIGLGKQKGCTELHSFGLYPEIVYAARIALEKAPIKAGLGIVENALKQTAKIAAVRKEKMEEVDAELLVLAKDLMPSLPAEHIDLLIVDEMGKNISGSGIDVNVIGRVTSPASSEEKPRVENIVALDLSDASHGNALGMGLADVITRRFADKINFQATYANVIAAGSLSRGKMPLVMENDLDAITVGLNAVQGKNLRDIKIMFINNTMQLSKLMVSQALLNNLPKNKDFKILDEVNLEFDNQGNLIRKGWW
ncbi:lactate racemase domain-containing protein [Desulfoscipio geothermicus]|nr:lactate racemase domain-containing protein [Desulfoscipio geothermicus]